MTSQAVLWTTLRISKVFSADPKAAEKSKRARYMRKFYRAERRRLDCTLTVEEFRKVKSLATSANLPPTTLFRQAAFAYLEKTSLISPATENQLSTLTFLFRNMANNLNQIAKHTNTHKRLSFFNAMQARETVLELEKLVKDFIENQ